MTQTTFAGLSSDREPRCLSPSLPKPLYAQVLMDSEAAALDRRTFTYKVPAVLQQSVKIGTPVLVPFGRQPALKGFVTGFSDTVSGEFKIKTIAEVLDEQPLFDLPYLEFLDWIAQNDGCTLQQVLQAALPASILRKLRKEVHLLDPNPKALEAINKEHRAIAGRIQHLLNQRQKAFTPKYLAGQFKLSLKKLTPVLYHLKEKGLVTFKTILQDAPQPKTEILLQLSEELDALKLTPRQQEIVDYLSQAGKTLSQSQLQEETGVSTSVIQKLVSLGVIKKTQRTVHRNPLVNYDSSKQKKSPLVLNDEQQQAVNAILKTRSESQNGQAALIHGVTGSGKTEVYLSLTQTMLTQGKSVMILLPEIALTSQITQRFINRLGIEDVAVWHSNLSDGERADTWRRIASGEIKLIIGARSAIFTPMQNLGLIVLDEAHDGSFKQDAPAPRYHAKTLAFELVKRQNATAVLGSATPDIGDYYQAQQGETLTGLPYRLLHLNQRYGEKSLAPVIAVDMQEERQQGHTGILSRSLKQALESNLQQQQQSIVLINRRGYYTLLQCRDCNHVFRCGQCDVSLTYHAEKKEARCHHCGFSKTMPQFCPDCAGMNLLQAGVGTQRIESEIKTLLPEARIARLDRDVTQRKGASREILNKFSAGQADILIGTQMIAKGLDIPNVTLVGVINADSTFYLPDYKSAERGFQLLTQVAGRAGRGELPGQVLLQTQSPEHPVINFARLQDFVGFYQYEIKNRQLMEFPPFSQLYRLIVSGPQEVDVMQFIEALAAQFKHQFAEAISTEALTLLGPSPCGVARLHGKYRYHCLLKTGYSSALHQKIIAFYRSLKTPQSLSAILDVDSQSLL